MKMAGLPFDETLITLRQTDTPERIFPHSESGKVPALKIDDGKAPFTVWDSLAVCETLAERHPEKHLWPEQPQARAHARSITAEMHAGFADVRRHLPMDFGRNLPKPELDDNTQKQIVRIVEIWAGALTRFGGLSGSGTRGGFLYGAFSIADAFYAPVVSRFETYGITVPSASDAYCKRILALPAMQEWRAAAMKE